MPQLFSTSRAEAALYRFPPLFFPAIIVLALVAQAYLPLLFHPLRYLDFPLLAVTYVALTSRHQGVATLTGAVLGILQDSLSHLALGVNGIAKTLIGFFASSLGVRIDADHPSVRLLVVFAMYWLNALVVLVLERFLLARPVFWNPALIVLAAAGNALLAIFLFRFWDRFRVSL